MPDHVSFKQGFGMEIEPGIWVEKTTTGRTVFRIMLILTTQENPSRREVFLHTKQFVNEEDALDWSKKIATLPHVAALLNAENEFWDNISQSMVTDHVERQRKAE